MKCFALTRLPWEALISDFTHSVMYETWAAGYDSDEFAVASWSWCEVWIHAFISQNLTTTTTKISRTHSWEQILDFDIYFKTAPQNKEETQVPGPRECEYRRAVLVQHCFCFGDCFFISYNHKCAHGKLLYFSSHHLCTGLWNQTYPGY